jgi:hypothetical protein
LSDDMYHWTKRVEYSESNNFPLNSTYLCSNYLTIVIVARAWERLRGDFSLIKQAFIQCGISIHPNGHGDHLIHIKGVDNSSIDSNGWRGWSAHNSHTIIDEDFDYMTAVGKTPA